MYPVVWKWLDLQISCKNLCYFAHTDVKVLKEARKICTGRLIVLFGCGGDRDKKKRRKMGQIANKYADLAYVTDDNPRTESPKKIRREIINNSKYLIDLAAEKMQ